MHAPVYISFCQRPHISKLHLCTWEFAETIFVVQSFSNSFKLKGKQSITTIKCLKTSIKKWKSGSGEKYQNKIVMHRIMLNNPCPTNKAKHIRKVRGEWIRIYIIEVLQNIWVCYWQKGKYIWSFWEKQIPMCMPGKLFQVSLWHPKVPYVYTCFLLCGSLVMDIHSVNGKCKIYYSQ